MSAFIVPRVVVAVFALLGCPSVVASDDSVAVPKPRVRLDDVWVYRTQSTDNVNSRMPFKIEREVNVVAFVDADKIHVVITRQSESGPANESLETDAILTTEWNALASGKRGARPGVIARPHGSLLHFPIKAGDRRDVAYEMVVGGNQTLKIDRTVRALRWETIKVPAGNFRALLVESTGAFSVANGPGSGRMLTRCWYVPEVNRWVRIEQDIGTSKLISELLEYKPASR
jgi:hypothetical protein